MNEGQPLPNEAESIASAETDTVDDRDRGERLTIETLRGLGTAPNALLVLASMYTLYFAREFFLPLILGVLLSFLLRPPVRFLARRGVPESLGAGLVLLAVLSAVSFGAYRMAGPAATWLDKAPSTLRNAEKVFAEIRRPVEQMREATQQVEDMATIEETGRPPAVEIGGPGLSDLIFGQMQALGVGAFTVVFLLYFLLAAGDLFLLSSCACCRGFAIASRRSRSCGESSATSPSTCLRLP